MQLLNIAIVAPGGNVGVAITKELLKDDRFSIAVLIRANSHYHSPSPNRITTIVADHNDKSSLVRALQGQDALLSCVPGGATKFAAQKLLVDAAIEAKVKLFFPSEYSADIMGPHYQRFPTQIVGDKVEIRRYLVEKASVGDIAYTAVNGGPFFDMWLRKGFAGFNIPEHKATIYGTGDNIACWTPLPVVATAIVNALRNPTPTLNRAIFICGVRDLTQNSLLAALEVVIGLKFDKQYVDVERLRQEALEALERGEPQKAMRGLTLNAQFNEKDSAANFWDKVENSLLGVTALDVKDAVMEFIRFEEAS